MMCTVCRVKLKVRVYEGALVQECPSCKGLFVEHETLAKIARDEIAPRDEAEREAAAEAANGRPGPVDLSPVSARRCSACGKTMARYTYAFSSAVIVDGCPEHGIWLDAGEIERIEAWAEAERRGMIQGVSRHIAGYDSPGGR
jgi:Zn-finger nucleic acid-binding protein